MKNVFFIALLAMSLPSKASTLSIAEPNKKWSQLEVKVCWIEDRPFNRRYLPDWDLSPLIQSLVVPGDEVKEIIQNKITSEFTPERTGIHFTHWESCDDLDTVDAIVMIGDSRKLADPMNAPMGKASIGTSPFSGKPYIYVNVRETKSKNSALEVIAETALHEFGHLAGLRHEHINSQAFKDPSCMIDNDLDETPDSSTRYFSVYDPSSIMNYCLLALKYKYGNEFSSPDEGLIKQYTDGTVVTKSSTGKGVQHIKIQTTLSQGDIHGLKCLYVDDEVTREKNCRPDFLFQK